MKVFIERASNVIGTIVGIAAWLFVVYFMMMIVGGLVLLTNSIPIQ